MFGAVLIANRGEIACRIIRTLQRLGIRAVAVYADADRRARHVEMADEAIRIGPAPASESYLRGDVLLDAAFQSGAEAIHPGYGFLAENAGFARACADAGVVFIGPCPETIELMGAKDRAKEAMAAAGIPVVPGFDHDDGASARLLEAARAIGFPILIKAASGGGGRGMRVVRDEVGFAAALDGARREAAAAFGDHRVLLERYLERPRHVEVQVFGDSHGNVVHLFERDCSIQRRHQKIVEEAPAPCLAAAQRAALHEAAVRAADAIGYEGAGTVEFLVDRSGDFFFIEMNTRLQVEHPVTEAIVGLDLVEWQLGVAAGRPLPRLQDAIAARGHAIEVRLCAEDPDRDFVPSAGRLARFHIPAHVEWVDHSGFREGDEVSLHYDSLLAKIVAHGADREQARRRLLRALAGVEIAGPATNLALLRRVVDHADFRSGGVDTGWLAERLDDLTGPEQPGDEDTALAALWLLATRRRELEERARASADPVSPWHRVDGWRLNDVGHSTLRLGAGDRTMAVDARVDGSGYHLVLGARTFRGEVLAQAGDRWRIELDGRIRRVGGTLVDRQLHLFAAGRTLRFALVDPLFEAEPRAEAAGLVMAPMPGKIVRQLVGAGDTVERGAPLLVLEAMKMEHTLAAPSAGRIAALRYREGERVEEGSVLLDFEAAPDAV